MAEGITGHCARIRANPSTMFARHFLRSSPLEDNAAVSVIGLFPQRAEKRKLVPPASSVITILRSSSGFMFSFGVRHSKLSRYSFHFALGNNVRSLPSAFQ